MKAPANPPYRLGSRQVIVLCLVTAVSSLLFAPIGRAVVTPMQTDIEPTTSDPYGFSSTSCAGQPDCSSDNPLNYLQVATSSPAPYNGSHSLRAIYNSGPFVDNNWPNGYARGQFEFDGTAGWAAGDDVWYSGAFYLPGESSPGAGDDFYDRQGAPIDLMRWDTYHNGISNPLQGGILIWSDHKARLITQRNVGTPVTLMGPFSLPTGRWFHLEVHQTLSTTSGSAYNEVFVDGQPRYFPFGDPNFPFNSSTTANIDTSTAYPIDRIRYGLVSIRQQLQNWLFFDRLRVSTSQVGALNAPTTPTGLGAFRFSGGAGIYWNCVSGVSGYRVYRKEGQNGNWKQVTNQTSPCSDLDFGLQNDKTYHYRVASYNSSPNDIESIQSSSISVPPTESGGSGAAAFSQGAGVYWECDASAAGYRLYRQEESASSWTLVADQTRPCAYIDRGLAGVTTYRYRVVPYDVSGAEGADSANMTVTAKR